MNTLRYVTITFQLPDGRILLSRQRLNKSSATQWRATAEYVIGPEDSPRAILESRCTKDFNFEIKYGANLGQKFQLILLPPIKFGNGARELHSYIIKIRNMWKLRAPRVYEFHAKPFTELLDDIYQNSVYKPGFVQGKEKHTFNAIHVISMIDKKGFLRNEGTNV